MRCRETAIFAYGWFISVIAAHAIAAEDIVIGDFETEANVQAWMAHGSEENISAYELTTAHAVSGKTLKATFQPAKFPGIAIDEQGLQKRNATNWSDCHTLKFSVHADSAVDLNIRIDDTKSTGYNTRYNNKIPLKQGANYIQISIRSIAQAVDVSAIKFLLLYLSSTKREHTLTFDSIAIGASEPLREKNAAFASLEAMPVPYR